MIEGCLIALCDLQAIDPLMRMNKRLQNRLTSKIYLSKIIPIR
jgi:hypothetical protein